MHHVRNHRFKVVIVHVAGARTLAFFGWPPKNSKCSDVAATGYEALEEFAAQWAELRTADRGQAEFHRRCKGVHAEAEQWYSLTFTFNLSRYVDRVNWLHRNSYSNSFRSLGGKFLRALAQDSNHLTSFFGTGITICAPVITCLEELDGKRKIKPSNWERLPSPWWRNLINLTRRNIDLYLCDMVLPVFLKAHVAKASFTQLLFFLPHPIVGECTAAIGDIGQAWMSDTAEGLLVRSVGQFGIRARSTLRLAICLQGGARSFYHPEVFLSIRDNLVRSLNASFLRLFYVLNLTSDICSWDRVNMEVRTLSMQDVMTAIGAISDNRDVASISFEPPCCWPALRPGLEYADCFHHNLASIAQSSGKSLCEKSIVQYEDHYNISFDWVMWARPDLRWNFPIGNIGSFEEGHVYVTREFNHELGDLFALLPRDVLRIYTTAFREYRFGELVRTSRQGASGDYYCLRYEDIVKLRGDGLCDSSVRPGCFKCYFGGLGCVLEHRFLWHNVSFVHVPEEIVTRVRMASNQTLCNLGALVLDDTNIDAKTL